MGSLSWKCSAASLQLVDPETGDHDMLTRRFWTGWRIFVVVGDITSWQTAESPLAKLAGFVIVWPVKTDNPLPSRARERT